MEMDRRNIQRECQVEIRRIGGEKNTSKFSWLFMAALRLHNVWPHTCYIR